MTTQDQTSVQSSRRKFLAHSAAGVALAGAAFSAPKVLGAAKPRVVIIGGGIGGATVARYVAKDSKGAVDVTLVEPTRTYYTCFFSNLYLGGFVDFSSLGHGYATLASDYGVNVIHDFAVGVDRGARTVTLANGASLGYDKLVLSPGIDFVEGSVPGWDLSKQGVMPHAYKGATQAQLLKSQIAAMPQGGVYCMVAPPNPFRCPPGPYERICMVAHYLKQHNPRAKIIIADPKPKFSKQALFEEGWGDNYSGMIDRIDSEVGGGDVQVRPDRMEVVIGGEVTKVDVCNVIPAQRAGTIARVAGVTDSSGWAPVEPTGMRSRKDANVHVLGDASAQGDMPKSGFSANSQAKVCANAVTAELTDSRKFPAKFSNTCWSLVSPDNGIKVGASYAAKDDKISKTSGFVSKTGESAALRKKTYQESLGWYAGITSDTFGS